MRMSVAFTTASLWKGMRLIIGAAPWIGKRKLSEAELSSFNAENAESAERIQGDRSGPANPCESTIVQYSSSNMPPAPIVSYGSIVWPYCNHESRAFSIRHGGSRTLW